jgi:hypothetical protein
VVGNGFNLYSCDNGNNADYQTISGTSMSSPNVCGSIALLMEYYTAQNPGAAMRASTAKGLVIHTADDLGTSGPDYANGWGLVNTKAAADVIKDAAASSGASIIESTVSSGTPTRSYPVTSDGSTPVKATLCWTDPPGTATTTHDNRTPRLVNDLDLRIVGPSATYSPYKLDYNNPSAAATTGDNTRDNVEQVVANGGAGSYSVNISHKGALSMSPQNFSLIITGAGGSAEPDLKVPHYKRKALEAPEGESFWVDGLVSNVGAAAAAASHCELWLSIGNDFDTNDDTFVGEVPVSAFAAGAGEWVRWNFTMPDLSTASTYDVYALFNVDSRGEVAESNEVNLWRSIGPAFSGKDGGTLIDNALVWQWKTKFNQKKGTGKGKLKAMGFAISPGVAEHMDNGKDIGLKAAVTFVATDGPRVLTPKAAKNGQVKKYSHKSKKDGIVVYKPKKDKLVYKVWQNAQLPDAVVVILTGGTPGTSIVAHAEAELGATTNGE